ncbi:hypothetical protein [Metapseudomonas otitidis]|uniref:hypothetical protein n=1 Tax=Metapseudomonas otitidis TaxID=319939 RepID=UPI001F0E2C87|nr:hypothetical protein [Pseudomonas otitidis]
MINYRALIATLYFIAGLAWAGLTPEQRAAKDKGLALYQQSDWYDSQPLLQLAAEAAQWPALVRERLRVDGPTSRLVDLEQHP